MPKHLTYFASDTHLGLKVGNPATREKAFVAFLKGIRPEETSALYLLGDIFDFWYEYRYVVPKGGVRVLGAITDLIDAGVPVYYFRGNHDLWTFSYFEELGITMLEQPYLVTIGKKTFCLGHGDALGPGDTRYKFNKWLFTRKLSRILFSMLHPWVAFKWATGWSERSRNEKPIAYIFKGEDERLYKYCKKFQQHTHVDHFIFGHYHARVDMPVDGGARLHILGDWMTAPNWLVFDSATDTLSAEGK